MFIHIHRGTYHRIADPIGDFCPICRSIQMFLTCEIRFGLVASGTPIAPGKRLGYEGTCRGCRFLQFFSDERAKPVHRNRGEDMVDFAARTSPRGLQELMWRVDLEHRVETNQIAESERSWLLEEPFLAVEYQRRKYSERGSGDGAGRLLASAFFIGLVVVTCLWAMSIQPLSSPRLFAVTISASIVQAVLGASVVWARCSASRRKTGQYVIRPVVRAWSPLRPTDSEIKSLVDKHEPHRCLPVSLTRLLAELDRQWARN